MPLATDRSEPLSPEVWKGRAEAHFRAALEFTAGARYRRDRGQAHPVADFLFRYYPYPLALLEQWHPGTGFALESCADHPLPAHFTEKHYTILDGRCFVDPSKLPEKGRARLNWIASLLRATASRPAHLSCHGLHEWAMVYRAEEIRHASLAPLRLPQHVIDALVESRSVICSHHDAFRFFAKQARPLNRLQPSLDTRHEHEQPGCVHANMDLYKWAAKSMPWIGSDLLLETFRLACELRDLDMRASPYDLAEWGVSPIKIETSEGRKYYEGEQRRLAEKASPLREKIIARLGDILAET